MPVTVSGIVTRHHENAAAAVPFQPVNVWIVQRSGQGFIGSATSTRTDQFGRYAIATPVGSRISVAAWSSGELQPCLAAATVETDTTLNLDVIAASDAPPDWRPDQWPAAPPIVEGVVYERTQAGDVRPLPDAAIWVDVSVDVYQAFTKTNDAGGFFLCRLDAPVRIDVELGGFVGASLSLGSGEQAPLEIELKRR